MVSFTYRGEEKYGELRTFEDGSQWARLANLDSGHSEDELIMVMNPDGTMPDDISDVALNDMQIRTHFSDSAEDVAWREKMRKRDSGIMFIHEMMDNGIYSQEEGAELLYKVWVGNEPPKPEGDAS